MNTKTVGLCEKDVRLYYVDIDFVVMDNPYNGGKPTVVMRAQGQPNVRVIEQLLERLEMERVGEPYFRDDGLWCSEVRRRRADVIM